MLKSTFAILLISGMATVSASLGVFWTSPNPEWIVANPDEVQSEGSATIDQGSVRSEVEQSVATPNASNLSADIIADKALRTENVVMSMTHPTISIDHRIVEPSKTIMIIGQGFLANSQLDVKVGRYTLDPVKTSTAGSLRALVEIPDYLTEGPHKLEISDASGGTASHELLVKSFKEKVPRPVESVETTFTADFFPPVTTATIEGRYNSLNGWLLWQCTHCDVYRNRRIFWSEGNSC